MSFKLFFLSTFGGIKDTAKFEAEHKKLWKDYQEFLQIDDSEELKSFLELEKFVQSSSFTEAKNKIQNLKYKGSDEDKQMKEFSKLQKDKRLKKYFKTVGSTNLKRLDELKDSDTVKKYFELKDLFDKGKLKDDKEKLNEFKTVKKLDDIRFFLKYPKSSEHKNYIAIHNAPALVRYEKLKKIVNSDEFISRKVYLEDAKKWEKTDEYQKEQLYLEMKKRPQLVNYFNYKDSTKFDFFKNWNLVFEDQFDGKLDETRWSPVSKKAQDTVGKNFSQVGDLQGYTSKGENISTDGSLQVESRREKTDSLVWTLAGFRQVEMDYSSGILTTADLFEAKFGILEAKIKYQPQKELVDVFYLAGEDQSTRVNLVEFGKVNRMGVFVSKNNEWQFQGVSLGGLSAGKSYIFRLEWERGKLCWKINNKEVFTTTVDVPIDGMNINLASLVVEDSIKLPHRFTVEWVRFFQHK